MYSATLCNDNSKLTVMTSFGPLTCEIIHILHALYMLQLTTECNSLVINIHNPHWCQSHPSQHSCWTVECWCSCHSRRRLCMAFRFPRHDHRPPAELSLLQLHPMSSKMAVSAGFRSPLDCDMTIILAPAMPSGLGDVSSAKRQVF